MLNFICLNFVPFCFDPNADPDHDRYYLVDGQHRACCMRKMNDGKDVVALCQVYSGLTYEQEAELYYKLDRAKVHLRLSSAAKALLESGSDSMVTDIKRRKRMKKKTHHLQVLS